MSVTVLSVTVEPSQREALWGTILGTPRIGWFPGGLPAGPTSGNQLLSSNEAAGCSCYGRSAARAKLATLDVQVGWRAPTSKWVVPDDRDSGWPAANRTAVTVQTVIELCQQRQLDEAVEALGVLVHDDCLIVESLFYAVLKLCVVKKDLPLGRRVHALVVKKGYLSDTFLCNHILRMYASHARLQEAVDVFYMVANPDAFTWSAIISAHVKHGRDKQAIALYLQMRGSGVKPDGHVFVAALQACGRGGDLESGQKVHADVLGSGVEHDLFVSSCLVDMYAKCGSLEGAQMVFDGLPRKDVVTWSALIAGYSQQDMGQKALRLYRAMREEGLAAPNSVTFVCLLRACASIGILALEEGKQLHVEIRERGLQGNVFVGGALVSMYAKCGSLEDARVVFDCLSERNAFTWSALISGYTQHGKGEEALSIYRDMLQEGIVAPDSVTFTCLLQACANLGTSFLENGRQLHAHIRERGLQADVFVASSLVNMFSKCGSLEDAQRVFDGLGQKNVVTWNAMISGYSQQGKGQEALQLYDAMQEEGIVPPNSVTCVCLLQACANLGTSALEQGRRLHAHIREIGLLADILVSNSLVRMYAKCGSLEDAQRVFDGLCVKNLVTWNAIIAGYTQQGLGQEALCLHSAMQEEGSAELDSVTFVTLLQACASAGTTALEKGRQLHLQLRAQGLSADVFVGSSLVNMYAKCGSLEDARGVFDELPQKDIVTWSAMIAGYSQQGLGQEALCLYNAMRKEGVVIPDSVTFVCLLQACASVGSLALEQGKELHVQIQEQGLQNDVVLGGSLVNMYAKCGNLEGAENVFDGLRQKNVVTWNAMITGYAQQGMGEEALQLHGAMQEEGTVAPDSVTVLCLLQACASVGASALEKGKQLHARIREKELHQDLLMSSSLVNMYAKCGSLEDAQLVFETLPRKDLVMWNSMIAGYSQNGMGPEALGLYRVMQEDNKVAPDSVTFLCLLQACANMAALHLGRQLHAQIKEEGLQADVLVASSLVNMYGKCCSMGDAREVFAALRTRDVVAWNALIAGYANQGDSEEVFDLIFRMREDGKQPDGVTFLSVLTVCSHRGLVDKGRAYFEFMSKKYGLTPNADHYTCMVDLLGRAGHLDEALALARAMPVSHGASVWHTLLGACRKWSNVEVGRHAFDEALRLDEKDGAAYVSMLNIYTGAQMWEEARQMQVSRVRIGAWKQPGQSWWTDMDGLVHSFVVGDHKHPGYEAGPFSVASVRTPS